MTVRADKPHLSREHMLDLLKQMIRIRRFEDKCAELYTQEKIRGFLHLYDGEEAVAVGVIPVLEKRDRIVATYREHGHALARGVPMTTVMAEMYGKQEGCSRGRGGSMHLFDAATNFYGGNAIVGGGLPLAVGLALADQMQSKDRVIACFFGEGAVAEGEFHETMNLAALWKLPVLFVCENNLYAMGTALAFSESETDIQRKAACYGSHPRRRRHGCGRRRGGCPSRSACGARKPQAIFSGMPHLSVTRAFDVRSPALSRQGRGRSQAPERADRALSSMAATQSHHASGRAGADRSRGRCRDRRSGRVCRSGDVGAGRTAHPLVYADVAAADGQRHEQEPIAAMKMTYREAMRRRCATRINATSACF